MTYREAIKFVRHYNAWRRAWKDVEQPDPFQVGQAIDILCDGLESSLKKLEGWPCSFLAFRELLAAHRVIPRIAIEDPEEYDGGETMERIHDAHYDLINGFAACECGNEHLQKK
jgi:hypothetical protein